MKVGRLKSGTLSSILRSVGISPDESPELANALPSSCKYYIPPTANNPLYGTLAIDHHHAVASAVMAASNPNQPEQADLETPAVGSAHESPVQTLSPETTIALQAVSSASRSSRNLQSRGTRWASFIENRTSPQNPPNGDLNEHRRAQSLPNQRDVDVNIQTLHLNSPPRQGAPSQETAPQDNESPQSSRYPSRLSIRSGSNRTSQSLDTITIPVLPAIPEISSGSRLVLGSTDDSLTASERNDRGGMPWLNQFDHINIEWSMNTMDTIYSASFYSYIRDEKNVDLASVRLSRIIKDYKPRQVALALRWLTQGWSVENTSRLLRNVFLDWLPDLAACVFTLMSKDWPVRPQMSLCIAYLLINEPPAVAAVFLRTVTVGWKRDDAIEMISYLDGLLEWDQSYFHELMSVFTEHLREHSWKDLSNPRSKAGVLFRGRQYQDQVLEYLSTIYSKGPDALEGATVSFVRNSQKSRLGN